MPGDVGSCQTWLEPAMAVLNVFQVLALAYMADRSRQRRSGDLVGPERRRG